MALHSYSVHRMLTRILVFLTVVYITRHLHKLHQGQYTGSPICLQYAVQAG